MDLTAGMKADWRRVSNWSWDESKACTDFATVGSRFFQWTKVELVQRARADALASRLAGSLLGRHGSRLARQGPREKPIGNVIFARASRHGCSKMRSALERRGPGGSGNDGTGLLTRSM